MAFILRAFSDGADGAIICICHPGECHYVPQGNYNAFSMMNLTRKLLERIGINPERLRLEWVSSSEGIQFAETVTDFTQKMRELGPLGKSEGIEQDELKSKLQEVTKLMPYIKIVKREKLVLHLDNIEKYNELYTSEEIEKLFSEVISYYIDPEKCQACMVCARRCPVDAIISAKNQIHVIDQEKCIKCGTCLEACPPKFGAVKKISGEPVPPPIPEEERTIVRKSKEK